MTQDTQTAAPGVSPEVEAIRDLLDTIHAGRFVPLANSEGLCQSVLDNAESALTALLASAAGEPVAWKWEVLPGTEQYKRKGSKEGVYLEDPASLGIPMDHPSYRWTKLYTAPPPPVGDLQGVSQERIVKARAILARLCDKGLLSMSVPARDDDEDLILSAIIELAASRPAAPVAAVDAVKWMVVDQALINKISQEDGDTDYWLCLFSGTVCKGRYLWRQGHSPDRFVGEVGDVPALGNYVSHIALFKTPQPPPEGGIGESL